VWNANEAVMLWRSSTRTYVESEISRRDDDDDDYDDDDYYYYYHYYYLFQKADAHGSEL
jgi:hypothetical protein